MFMKESFPAPRVLRRAGLGGIAMGAIIWSSASLAAESPVPDLVERVSPSVVTVFTTQNVEEVTGPRGDIFGFPDGSPFEEFLRRFGIPDGMVPGLPGPGRQTPRQGLGSGFVFDADGYIITNHHVVEGADEVKVRFDDGDELDAEVVGTDPQTDIALIKVEAREDLPALKLGNSSDIRVGEDVIAVGNPFGLGGTVTRGIVSAIGRDINAGPYVDFIQTDAAINRGNSGGPLFDLEGNVIGVNSAIYSPSGGNVGVGFAIPSDLVKDVVAQLRERGSVDRGWLGVAIQTVTPDIASAMGLDDAKGALVASVVDDSPAVGALEIGDVILTYDGKPVPDSRALPRLVAATNAGNTVDLEILRNGEEQTVQITVGELEAERQASAASGSTRGQDGAAPAKLGATVATLSGQARESLGLDDSVSGAIVTSLKSGGAAAEAGLEVGDVIVRVGDQNISDASELDRALAATDRDTVLLLVNRRGSQVFMSVKINGG
ncbi:MAG TPA: DegQ family serine endoprotease [Paracoccaceae bacterium]|nr:DegQ family serine endoprotease [Paracoccaceae bacterium]